jgi:Transcriptional regulator PadR-like family
MGSRTYDEAPAWPLFVALGVSLTGLASIFVVPEVPLKLPGLAVVFLVAAWAWRWDTRHRVNPSATSARHDVERIPAVSWHSRLAAWLYRIRHRRELATARVLEALTNGDSYGLGLCRDARVGVASIVHILVDLEYNGLVASYWEQIDPTIEGRPRRRMYCLTLAGWSRLGR